jgi:hypothetical protein
MKKYRLSPEIQSESCSKPHETFGRRPANASSAIMQRSLGTGLPLAQLVGHLRQGQARSESHMPFCGIRVARQSSLRGFGVVLEYRGPSIISIEITHPIEGNEHSS